MNVKEGNSNLNKDFGRGAMLGIITMIAKRVIDEMTPTMPREVEIILKAQMLAFSVTATCQYAGIKPPSEEEMDAVNDAVRKALVHTAEVDMRTFQEEGR